MPTSRAPRILLLVVLLTGLMMAGLARAEQSVVTAFGDSITMGNMCSCTPYPARLAGLIGKTAVNAGIHTINGFSAHADQQELLAWHRQTGAKRTFLVHGEESTMQEFANLLEGTEVVFPELHSVHSL